MVHMAKRQATSRIIAGDYKGTKLSFKPNKNLRPTESKTKETLFNWLLNDLHNKRCLDMFAGTGALGLEALSRGADEVVFFEKQKVQNDVLAKNFLPHLATHATNVLESTRVEIHCHATNPAHFMAHATQMSKCERI